MINPFGAEICTLSNTTLEMQLSGMPMIIPADFKLVAFKLLTRMFRYTGSRSPEVNWVSVGGAVPRFASPEELF